MTQTKTGVAAGAFAINPINGDKIPVWVADYVIGSYGTGAVMAVPAHDERDHAFAEDYDLPIVQVVAPANGARARRADGSLHRRRRRLRTCARRSTHRRRHAERRGPQAP